MKNDVQVVKAVICEEMVRQCCSQFEGRLRAIVLTGSLARDEATVARAGACSQVLGDAEYLLIFRDRCALPGNDDLTVLYEATARCLRRRDVICPLSASATHARYLRKLQPDIFACELRASGQVLWGERDILSLIPPFSTREIPREDAWRLLGNRIVELLEAADELAGAETLPAEVHYRTVKLYLDMATSLLVFGGEYAPTYRERLQQLRALAAAGGADREWPFPLEDFVAEVSACTEWKLSGGTPPEVGLDFWERAAGYAERLWRWELRLLTGVGAGASNDDLLRTWMRHQPLGQVLRGWLYVLRKLGWQASWRECGRWIRGGWQASPRYWVYAAASELFFELPRFLRDKRGTASNLDGSGISLHLPKLAPQSNHEAHGWHRLVSEIVWNYKNFLVETRA